MHSGAESLHREQRCSVHEMESKKLLTPSFHATLPQSAENSVIFTALYLPTALITSYFQVHNSILLIHCHSSDKDFVDTAFFNLSLTRNPRRNAENLSNRVGLAGRESYTV